jgi:hypothetical protein
LTALAAVTAFAARPRRKYAAGAIAHLVVGNTPNDLTAARAIVLGVLLSAAAWGAILSLTIWVV